MSFLISFLLGAVAAACLPHAGWAGFVVDITPWSFPVFAVAIFYLYRQIRTATNGRGAGFAYAYLWAFGYFVVGLNWVGNAVLVDGNPYACAWPLALIGLPLILAIFLAVVMGVTARWVRRLAPAPSVIVFVALFTLAELARGHLFTGFPWNLPGMYWSETLPMFQSLAVFGIYGLTFFTILWAVVLGAVVTRIMRPWSPLPVGVAVIFLALLVWGQARLSAPPAPLPVDIVMVQANIPQSERMNPMHLTHHVRDHVQLSEAAATADMKRPVIIIWPETVVPPSYVDDPGFQSAAYYVLGHYPSGSALVTGAVTTKDGEFYNSIIAYQSSYHLPDINTAQAQILYHKYHLVPFGEYIPFKNYIPLAPVAQFDNMAAGSGPQTVTIPGIVPFRPLVCYEVIFPGAVYNNRGNEQWILNVTNDAWYGNSPGPYQHLAAARARAIERGLPLVRVAGTGISAVFDALGRELARIPYGARDAVWVK
jgi:apolipoprotein N-acyltransferase